MYYTKAERDSSNKQFDTFRVYIEKDGLTHSIDVTGPKGAPLPPHEYIVNIWHETKDSGKWSLEAIEIFSYSALDYYVAPSYILNVV